MTKKTPIVAIVGRTNVGKSSIFNTVLKKRQAIVAREAGTTRDSVTARASYNGQDFWLVDTAGMKDPDDEFELSIQDQIIQATDNADVIWVVIEANTLITEEDRRVANLALKSKKPTLLVVNKIDKRPRAEVSDYQKTGIKDIVLTSASQNRGIEDLLASTVAKIPKATIKVTSDRLVLALVGRPNVGKSSLFNMLGKKQQAIVSPRAGTTRDVNQLIVRYQGREVALLDTAGIRRSGKIERGIEKFSVIRALSAIEEADICLLLMDVNELNTQLDQKIAGLIKEAGKGLIIVISKWDSIAEHKTPFTRDQLAAQIVHQFAFVPWAPLLFTSAITGQNVTKILDLASQIDQQRHKRIKTTILNRWLAQIIDKHPPAGLKNRSPRLNYIVQEEDNFTPSFKVYGAHTKFLHWSYKRFMERELRQNFGFEGTPIRFWFIEKH